MIDGKQQEGLNELGFDGGSPDGHDGLLGEHRSALRHGPNITGELEISQIFQEFLAEQVPAPEVFNILGIKMEFLDILDDLLQAGSDGETAAVGTLTVEHIKIGDPVPVAVFKVTVGHGQLVEIAEHGQIDLVIYLHGNSSFLILLPL